MLLGNLLVLAELVRGCLHACLQLLQLLLEGGGATILPLPLSQEHASRAHLGLHLLGHRDQLLTGGLGLLRSQLLGGLRREGLDCLGHLLHLLLRSIYPLTRLLHQGGLLPALRVLAELAKLRCSSVDALSHCRKLLNGRLGGSLLVLLHLQVLGGNEGASLADRRLHHIRGSLRRLDGVGGLLEGQHLNALEEGQLGVIHLLHGVLDLLRLLLALLDVRLGHDALARVLG
mmetsp:Transcript_84012/g.216275  ORF Transcript_84012/g.216275 Transcript_84012/m.216275 type:complete len:231 (+) Transcript_84012:2884-3576(+)